jgi:hypothetical protein
LLAAATHVTAQTPPNSAAGAAFAARLVAELKSKCPVAPVNDQGAFALCRDGLFRDSYFRSNMNNYLLWGRPPEGNINASLKEFKTTQFGPEVFTATYLPMWMFTGAYEFEYVAANKMFRITAAAAFRNELDYGQYPYPFWHDSKKWSDYENANTLAIWIEPSTLKVAQLTFYKRADRAQVVALNRRHMPTFDGKWMWVDNAGREQPAPTLFDGVFSDKNPHKAALDTQYRQFALSMRDADCMSCHVPNNPDKMRRLVLLQTPIHAASEIERVIKEVKEDKMPLDEIGIEKPLSPAMKTRLIKDAEDFATVVRAAREWELTQVKRQP